MQNNPPKVSSIKVIQPIQIKNQQTIQQLVQNTSNSSSSCSDDEGDNLRLRMATGIILKRRKRQSSRKQSDTQTEKSVSDTSSMRGNYSILSYQIGCYSNMLNSKILSSYGKLQLLFKQKIQIRLIFSASQQGFSSKRFHQLCDLYNGTMMICLTQTNKIIGGYTPLSWKENYERSKTYYKTDDNYETFMFSWDRKEKYFLAKSRNNRAICCFNGFGPCFGYDLQIGNDTFTNPNTSVGFPSNYYLTQRTSTPTRFQVFGTSKNEIKLKDYEVYQIIKKQPRKSIHSQGRVGLLTARQELCVNINNRRLSQTQEMELNLPQLL